MKNPEMLEFVADLYYNNNNNNNNNDNNNNNKCVNMQSENYFS